MHQLMIAGGIVLIVVVLWDAFETIILTRRVSRKLRLARLFYLVTWPPWRVLARFVKKPNRRENILGLYGSLSIILLVMVWGVVLIFGFALLQTGIGAHVHGPENIQGFAAELYLSGSTFITLGLGDVTPETSLGRLLVIIEAGTGFGFLALIISYLPSLSLAFSRRELSISLLDARAGSPPTAGELLRRNACAEDPNELAELLREWERWSAELLESHITFPLLAYFRSQHDNQSWIASLTAVLDASALVMIGVDSAPARSGRLTFAMARHALVDMCNVLHLRALPPERDRLDHGKFQELQQFLRGSDVHMPTSGDAESRLSSLRAMYEPYANALAEHLVMPLPDWLPNTKRRDNWQYGA